MWLKILDFTKEGGVIVSKFISPSDNIKKDGQEIKKTVSKLKNINDKG